MPNFQLSNRPYIIRFLFFFIFSHVYLICFWWWSVDVGSFFSNRIVKREYLTLKRYSFFFFLNNKFWCIGKMINRLAVAVKSFLQWTNEAVVSFACVVFWKCVGKIQFSKMIGKEKNYLVYYYLLFNKSFWIADKRYYFLTFKIFCYF